MRPRLTTRAKLSAIRQALRSSRASAAASVAARFASDASREVRVAAMNALNARGGARWTKTALRALADDDEIVVVSAIECLVEWETRASVGAIASLLQSESELVRTYAAWAIGRLAGKRFVPALRRRLADLGDEVEASGIAEALFMLTRERRYLTFLIRQLRSSDPEARAFTTNSLVGAIDRGNARVIMAALVDALATETSQSVLPSLRRDLEEAAHRVVELF